MRTGIVLLALLLARVAATQEHAPRPVADRIDLESITALAVQFASCAALHVAAAEALESADMLAYADTARRRAEVDQLALTYLLAEDRAAKGGTPIDPASFNTYVERLMAEARASMLAIVATSDPEPYKREEALCSTLTPLADEILTRISAD